MKKRDLFYIIGGILGIVFCILFIYFSNSKNNDERETTTTKIITTTTTTSITSTIASTTSTTSLLTTSTTTSLNTSTTSKLSSTKTTKKTTTSKKTLADVKVIVNQTYEHKNDTSYKYGTKINTEKRYLVTLYSDGSTKKEEIMTSTTYDRSGFKASTSDLLPEAKTLSKQNKGKYQDMLKYLNQYRTEADVETLWLDDELSVIATIRALELGWGMGIDKMAHERPDGRGWSSVYKDMDYFYVAAGENIAAGQQSVATVSKGWKNSPSHYANMINTTFTKVGFGYVEVDGIKYWVQLFAK